MTISNMDDIIDSREVIARIDELEGERDTFLEEWLEAHEFEDVTSTDDSPWEDENADDAEELNALVELAAEGEGSPDWVHGEALISESYFTRYAEQMAEDIGAIDPSASWPLNHIDWEAAASALQQDYFSVDYGDQSYWIRA